MPAVLVVTNEQDVGADFLIQELASRQIEVVRFNTERSPDWKLSLRPGKIWSCEGPRRSITSETCIGVWWRRPEVPAPPPGTGPATRAVADQWFAFLAGLASVPGPVWVSHPASIRRAESKAIQLRAAAQVGLKVPGTLWTNEAAAARTFLGSNGGVVKSVASAWWQADAKGHFVFASRVQGTELPAPERLAAAPLCFQQLVHPKRDVRVTVVGDAVLAASRNDGGASEEPLDWRLADPADWAPYELPKSLVSRCRRLVRGLDLRFGGLDFAVADDGTHWFLELNPNGEWGWLQKAGLPIAEALREVLVTEPTAGPIGKRVLNGRARARWLVDETRAQLPSDEQVLSLVSTTFSQKLLPTPSARIFNRLRLRQPQPAPELPGEAWALNAQRALLADSQERRASLEGKGPGLATVAAVIVAGSVLAISAGWNESTEIGRIILGIAAAYTTLSLQTPLWLVGPLARPFVVPPDLTRAVTTENPDRDLAERAADVAMSLDLQNTRIANLLDASRRELKYSFWALAIWVVLVPLTGILRR